MKLPRTWTGIHIYAMFGDCIEIYVHVWGRPPWYRSRRVMVFVVRWMLSCWCSAEPFGPGISSCQLAYAVVPRLSMCFCLRIISSDRQKRRRLITVELQAVIWRLHGVCWLLSDTRERQRERQRHRQRERQTERERERERALPFAHYCPMPERYTSRLLPERDSPPVYWLLSSARQMHLPFTDYCRVSNGDEPPVYLFL